MKTLATILTDIASRQPDKPLFVFPENRWNPHEAISYAELATRSAAAARSLLKQVQPGERALLLFSTGSPFWEAFLGALACGVIAVPLHIPNFRRSGESLEELCRDCQPSIVLTDEKTAELLQRPANQHLAVSQLPCITPSEWRHETATGGPRPASEHDLALLQYTSGSTAQPKGVQISHGNLFANLTMIRDRMGIREGEDTGVTWLPHYHDMGLVGSYLTTLFTQNTTICLPPEDFILRPAKWLEQISMHRASVCGGPDFSYRLCTDKIPEDQLANIDLTSWRIAYVGAERIRAETLRRFTRKFADCGFRESAFFPCYGLGEATLMATGGPPQRPPVLREVSSDAMSTNRITPPTSPQDATTMVGCGNTFLGSQVVIEDLETGQLLPDERIGEVCLSGPAVTQGYFHRDELNEQAFSMITLDDHAQRFLHTGDLGFLAQGELFITGRKREIIIIRGRNLSPEDIEQSLSGLHPALIPGAAVAFSIDHHGQESLILAVELKRNTDQEFALDLLVTQIRNQVINAIGVNPIEILLLRHATIPRTSSGKSKRLAVRDLYLNGTLESLFREQPAQPVNSTI